MSKPKQAAILIVTGAYFLPEAWAPFMDDLSAAGFISSCPRLPTCGDVRPPKATFQNDVTVVRDAAVELVEAGHPVIVLAHSYGGIVASEAISEDLYAKDPVGPGVVHLIYLSAWLVLPGKSLSDVFEKHGFQCKAEVGFNEDGTVYVKNTPDAFYNDIESDRAQELSKRNVTHNSSTFSHKASHAPWKEVSMTYVHCVKDMAIYLELQENMVKDLREDGAADLVTVTCDSGHCPFLNRPAEVIQMLEKVWRNVQSR